MIAPFTVNQPNTNSRAPMWASHSAPSSMGQLWSRKPDSFASAPRFGGINTQHQMALTAAIARGNRDDVMDALSGDVDFSERRADGETPLHALASSRLTPSAMIAILKTIVWNKDGTPNLKVLDALDAKNERGQTPRQLLLAKFNEAPGVRRIMNALRSEGNIDGVALSDLEIAACRLSMEGLESKRTGWENFINARPNKDFLHRIFLTLLNEIGQSGLRDPDLQEDLYYTLGGTLKLCRMLPSQKNDRAFKELAKGADIAYRFELGRPFNYQLETLLE